MRLLRQVRGLTLIELMVVLVILALLSAIAYPLYSNQTRKARRVEAKSTLMGIALAEERYLSRMGSYATDAQLDANGQNEYTELISRMTGGGDGNPDYYAIAVAAAATSFTVTATAQGIQEADTDCAVFSVNQLGQRLAVDADGADKSDTCW